MFQTYIPPTVSSVAAYTMNNKVLLAPLAWGSPATDTTNARPDAIYESKCDLAGMSMAEYRDLIETVTSAPASPFNPPDAWYFPLVTSWPQTGTLPAVYPKKAVTPDYGFRYRCKPWVVKQPNTTALPLQMHDELAQASPIFMRGCSQFVV